MISHTKEGLYHEGYKQEHLKRNYTKVLKCLKLIDDIVDKNWEEVRCPEI